jgi:NAD(P)H-quinone oxidoreductase subunit 5
MSNREIWMTVLGLIVVGAPAALVFFVGVPTLLGFPRSEHATDRAAKTAVITGLMATLMLLGLMLTSKSPISRHFTIEMGNWVEIDVENEKYQFEVKLLFDRLSVPFVILSYVLCGTIGAFAHRYMHRERGFNRFFVLYAIFLLGMVTTSLAGTIETLFAGWELVGLSSAMLVAFYHERPAPCRNGLRVWVVYRVSDAALLTASVIMHHLTGNGDFDKLVGTGPWPEGEALIATHEALIVGVLVFIAAAGKSALVPFSGWLPRAMEGPTPSSAVFYGALSVHLGAFLLLRIDTILELSPWLSAVVVATGLITAVFASFAGRVQTDIKCALSFASVTQVGIIVAEIGLGWRYIALVHILGHGCLRTLQFLRAPNFLLDYRKMENAVGASLPRLTGAWERLTAAESRPWYYRLALERGYLDACLSDGLVYHFLRFFRVCGRLERRWVNLLNGGPISPPVQLPPAERSVEAVR